MDTIFKDNPSLDVAYKTADGKYFYTENGAQNHALTLRNQEVKKVVRPEEEIEKEESKTVTTTQPSDISENSESTDTSETSKEETKTVATTQPSDISENSENSNISETLEPSEEEDSEETKPNLELKSNKQNKR
nr:MAG TPA: hypothetical protein [Caudoviricetes sp.]